MRVADFGHAIGQRRGHGDDWQLVDHVGDFGAGNLHALEFPAIDVHGAVGLAGGIGNPFTNMRAHAGQYAEQPGAGAIEAEVGDSQVRAGPGGGGGDPEGGG